MPFHNLPARGDPAAEGAAAARRDNYANRFPVDADQFVWSDGEKDRPFSICRPCACGCDTRGGHVGWAGYVTGSDADGNGFSLWIKSEDVFERIAALLSEGRA